MPQYRILVAEDDDLVAELIVQILKRHDFEVIRCADGEAAVANVASRRPDAVILDSMMPGMDGLEVLQELQKAQATKSIPVMILSARSNESDLVHGFDFGARDYMVKPFKPEELVVRLRRMLRAAHERDA